jgi:integral membrane protein (TIGR01906 family)
MLFKPLYYMDINVLDIEASTNLNKEELKTNYDYLITYLTNDKVEEFNLPTLPSSISGKIHFKEVKVIFDTLRVMLFYSIIISIVGILINNRQKKIKYLLTSSIVLIVLPIILLIPFLINFDKSFTIFHQIFFKNDYWLFDIVTDPIITILPQNFFFHCALLIIVTITIFSLALRFIYRVQYKRLHSL